NPTIVNNASGTSKNDQESYPQIKIHNSITVDKEVFTSSSSLDLSN
ncbi:30_t:CDS:1, partial [Dentiscutata erythropus]